MVIEVWAHDGTTAERDVLNTQVAAFNADQDRNQVKVRFIPEGDYNDALQSATVSGSLPDLVEIDGPLLSSYVYQDAVLPLDDLLSEDLLDRQLPSLKEQGTVNGRAYSVGVFDSGLGLYADRRALQAAGVEWPTSIEDAWTSKEFDAALASLAANDPDGKVLDLKLNYGTGEWLTYGFAPLVFSAGGELIDPQTLSPVGHLDAEPALTALRALQGWASYVDANAQDDAFTSRRAPLSWVGHWTYRDYADALGSDLLILPLPDLGHGTKTGQGSWTWSIPANDRPGEVAAASFLSFLLSDSEVLRMTDANGAVPGTASALAASDLYGAGKPLELFAQQLSRSCGAVVSDSQCVAVPRQATPGYGVLTSSFSRAVAVALRGRDPARALEQATRDVEQDLQSSNGYQ